jgi:hypothetical protein
MKVFEFEKIHQNWIFFFLNGKNQAQTYIQIIYNFFKRTKIGTNGFGKKLKLYNIAHVQVFIMVVMTLTLGL